MVAAAVDWTMVLTALIFTMPAIIAAWYARDSRNHARQVGNEIKTPSGDSIGQVVERSHDIACVNHAILKQQNGGHDPKGEGVAKAT